jgi:predicted PurR-regulated permease PerM
MSHPSMPPRAPTARALTWAERRDRIVVALGITVFVIFGLWLAGHIARALILLVVAALLAYALAPAVRALRRFMPRGLALAVVYLLLVGIIVGIGYLVVSTTIQQLTALIPEIKTFLAPGPHGQPSPLLQTLRQLGLSQQQIDSAQQQLTTQLEGVASSVVPFVEGLLNSTLDLVLVLVISVYLLIDGERVTIWLHTRTPLETQGRIGSFLDILQRVVGGYIRGQLIMSTLVGVLVGVGMAVLRVPDPMLLGVLAFILEFIPVLGTLVSGIICVALALTLGWLTAVLVLAYFVVVHVLEGDVVGPRVLGRAVGLHPAVSLVALIAGGELYGILGALFAAPVAGLAQAIIHDIYVEWRKAHPADFAPAPAIIAATETTSAEMPLPDAPPDGITPPADVPPAHKRL